MMKKIPFIPTTILAILLATTSCKTIRHTPSEPVSETVTITTEENKTFNFNTLPAEQLNGEWIFTQACGQPVIGDEPVRIIFNTEQHRIYGNNGCNTFNGTLLLEEGCAISFTDCLATTKACRPEVTDTNVMEALGQTAYYNVIRNNNEGITIELLNNNGERTATIERKMSEILNGNWEVTEINGKKVKLDNKPSIALAMHDKKLSGNSGCNLINGDISYDAITLNNKIRFTSIASTTRMCEPKTMEVENALLDALNKIGSYIILNNNTIVLCDNATQKEIITLQRK